MVDGSPRRPDRRRFLRACVVLAGGGIATASEQDVTIVEFSNAGRRQGKVRVPKIARAENEWRMALAVDAFEVTRHAATERPFSGRYWNLHEAGVYRCVCCGTAAFGSDAKFDSGTGWPSFWQPLATDNIQTVDDRSFGMLRTAVSCRRCDAHLGHVFDDGPRPTGLRYCINSVALRFVGMGVSPSGEF